tara:strand:+ start:281 stop:460 length:180 start_codon:yes stop_codon:yes gene_type:complete
MKEFYEDDFIYKKINLVRPNGSIVEAREIVNIPIGEKGEIYQYYKNLEKSSTDRKQVDA